MKDTRTPTVNLGTININIAAQPGYCSKLPRWRLSHSHDRFTDNYITTMAGSDSVPTTTSSENGNKVSNPPLMGNPL